jgi:hypothetical protein
MKNTPKSIFLQIGEDVDATDWNEIHPECVSWCTERINDNDLEYVLAFALKENSGKLPEPKPITPEMLEAYGFEKNDMGEGEVYYSLRLSDERYCDLSLITGDKNGFMEVCLFTYEEFFRVRYEHEMLAMYKGITGKDLFSKQYFKSKVIPTSKFAKAIREASLFDADLSIRCLNVFHANKDKLGIDLSLNKVKDLSKLSIREFLSCRNAGKKTAEELKELCFYAGVELMP